MADAGINPAVADVLRKLTTVFTDFEGRLNETPLIRKLQKGRFTLADYQAFLINLRQQVKDGALWMSRAASHVGEAHLELRSKLMRHAVTEHRDFRLLEADYIVVEMANQLLGKDWMPNYVALANQGGIERVLV